MSLFGDRLKAARTAKGMTLVQCADALGITNPALSQWEQGKREPKYSMLVAICHLLDTTPNELLGIEPSSATYSVTGSGNVVAQGVGAKVQIGAPGELPQCLKCPHRKKLAKLEKLIGG